MKLRHLFSAFVLVFVICAGSSLSLYAVDRNIGALLSTRYETWFSNCGPFELSPFIGQHGANDPFEEFASDTRINIVPTPTDGGIKEDIPDKYKDRFEKWKTEFLSTDFGRQQWDNYAKDRRFVLTILIAENRGKGAGTDKFLWDDEGNFVGATITLGAELDEGYPTPVYYPVLNSLAPDVTSYSISGKLLAATKISHEIGHVNQAAKGNMKFLQLQNKLMPVYNSIFLRNGLDTTDKKLVDLAQQMGGTPIEIWESREYWSEVNAMLFLTQRIGKEGYYCHVFNKIRRNLKEYARDYEQRFDQYSEYSGSPCWK